MHDAAQWAAVSLRLDALEIEHVIVDFPGFGTVPQADSIQDMADLVAWSKGEIERLTAGSTGPITLLGHSCGGRIALAVAAADTQYRQLVLIGSPNLYRPTLRVRLVKVLARLAAPVRCLLPAWLLASVRSQDYIQARATGMQSLYQSVVVDDQTALAVRIATKVQLLWGESDTAAPVRIAQELHQLLPDSTLKILPNLGHNLHHENPGLLAGTIALYLHHD